MRADEIMSIDVVTVSPETHIRDVAKKLLERGVSALPVVDDGGRILGIISEGDLMRRRESGTERHPSWWLRLLQNPGDTAANYVKSHGQYAKDVMTRKVITVGESTPAGEIAEILEMYPRAFVAGGRQGRRHRQPGEPATRPDRAEAAERAGPIRGGSAQGGSP